MTQLLERVLGAPCDLADGIEGVLGDEELAPELEVLGELLGLHPDVVGLELGGARPELDLQLDDEAAAEDVGRGGNGGCRHAGDLVRKAPPCPVRAGQGEGCAGYA